LHILRASSAQTPRNFEKKNMPRKVHQNIKTSNKTQKTVFDAKNIALSTTTNKNRRHTTTTMRLLSNNFISLAVCLLLQVVVLVSLPNGCWGFGAGTQQQEQQQQQEQAATAETQHTEKEKESMLNQMDIAAKLKELSSNGISNDDALSVAGLLDALTDDEETLELVRNLRKADEGTRDPQLQTFLDSATPKDIVVGLKQLLDELRSLEVLFRNPQRAVDAMIEDGMIDPSRIELYKENPEQLAQDVQSGIYFSFVTLAVAGGFL
jgi:hypothetical protein